MLKLEYPSSRIFETCISLLTLVIFIRSIMASTTTLQLSSLDDTDCYATAWQEALAASKLTWGGRGRGGRGRARRTMQPKDIVVDDVRLEYVGNEQGACRLLLESATVKFLSGRVYLLLGKNGSGKSSLLKRIAAGRVPGLSPHVSTLYIPQLLEGVDWETSTPLDYLKDRQVEHSVTSERRVHAEIDELEQELEALDIDKDQERIEELGEQISSLEDVLRESSYDVEREALEALTFMGIDERLASVSIARLSPGQRKKVSLSVALTCRCDLLLLDEPSNSLDVSGLLQLRRLVNEVKGRPTTVVMVSHDLDLINDVATDVIDLTQLKLFYYPGNYADYLVCRQQDDLHTLRQAVALDKKRTAMLQTLDHLKKQPTPKRGGSKKKAKQIESQRKKIERQGLESDEKGHRWTQQNAGTGIKQGSINALDASTRRGLTTQELLELTEKSVLPPPDKAVQFVFDNPKSEWGEPLILAHEVGHGYEGAVGLPRPENDTSITTKEGFLFDCVDLCVDEGGRYGIVGDNASGSSTLLRLLAKREAPLEGTVKHALNVDVGFLDQQVIDDMIEEATKGGPSTALAYLSSRYPSKSEKDIRGALTGFGLSPKQATTDLRFLSGGERRRLGFADIMLNQPQVLILDQPTADLDMESVEALVYGLNRWKGTLVTATHDANFLRSIYANCYALVHGKLQRVPGGIDTYLRSFS